MEWLNYHHLLYFWTVVREGGVVRASQVLRLSHPTISGQIRTLEEQLGAKLLERTGRRLALTDTGRIVYRYADDIFRLGNEMLDAVKGHPTGQPMRVDVGVADVLPKIIVRLLLEPAMHLDQPVRLVCREDKPERLLAALSLHEVHVILSDAPAPPGSPVRVYSHLLGETGVAFYGVAALAEAHGADFPRGLDGAPMLLPTENTTLRRSLDEWFGRVGVRPRVVGEFEDSALLKAFAGDGLGLFPAHIAIEAEVVRLFQARRVGVAEGVVERFYALSSERRLKHPAVVAIRATARGDLFAE